MKIRTEDEFQDAVDSETAWRKKVNVKSCALAN